MFFLFPKYDHANAMTITIITTQKIHIKPIPKPPILHLLIWIGPPNTCGPSISMRQGDVQALRVLNDVVVGDDQSFFILHQ